MTDSQERVGLCGSCRQCRRVQTPRSTFYLCERSLTDPAYPRYPPLPVRRCPGYDPGPVEPPGPAPSDE